MKITDIKVYMHYSVWRNIVFVKVETDEGISGLGEASLRSKEQPVKAAILEHMKPLVVGRDPFDIEAFINSSFIRDAWRNGVVFNTAIAAVEIAMWDIIGQKLGIPVFKMLGGRLYDKVPAYANTWFMECQSLDDYQKAARHVVDDLGFRAMKWDPFKLVPKDGYVSERKRVDLGIDNLKAVREAVGPDVELFLELHGSLSYDGALRYATKCAEFDPGFIEEPMHPDNFAGYRKLAVHSPVPIAAGERYFTRFQHRALNEEGFYSIVQPDVTHCLGILELTKMAAAADTYGLRFAPHNSGGPVGTMATLMVDASAPNFFYQEFSIENFDLMKRFFKNELPYKDGFLYLEDRPGLGLEPNWDEIEKEEYQYRQSYAF